MIRENDMNSFDKTIGNPSIETETREYKYSNYDVLKNIQGDWMIVASEPVNMKDVRNVCSSAYHNSPEILYDMLNLFIKLKIPKKRLYPRSAINNYLNDSHFGLIIQFCLKHGLPYYGNTDERSLTTYYMDNGEYFDSQTINDLKSKYNYTKMCFAYCNVSYFIYWLSIMYNDFMWYIACHSPNFVEQFENSLGISLDRRKKNASKFLGFTPIMCRMFKYESHLTNRNGNFSFEIETYNIFHLASYYFCLICIGGEVGEINAKIKKCKLCGSYFLTQQSRKKYCTYCSPQKAWNNAHRKTTRHKYQ